MIDKVRITNPISVKSDAMSWGVFDTMQWVVDMRLVRSVKTEIIGSNFTTSATRRQEGPHSSTF